MCRMAYIETLGYRPSAWRMVKFAMRDWGFSNDDGTGVAWQRGNTIYTFKNGVDAKQLFKSMDFAPKSGKIMGHCRAGTNGSKTMNNAHPFPSCDGTSFFQHNGIVSGYEKLKSELVAEGHKFTSETDSEVILHMIEKVGPAAVMKELGKHGVRGSANWIWFTPTITYAFSDGSLHLVENQKGLRVGLFSDLAPFGKKFFHKPKDLKSGTLVTIQNGKVVETKEVGSIPGGYAYSSDESGGVYRQYGMGRYRVIYPRRESQWNNAHTVTWGNQQFPANMANDEEWSEMLEQDSPKENKLELELAQPNGTVGLDKLFEGAERKGVYGVYQPEEIRQPVITMGKNVSISDAQYARAMETMLKENAKREAMERRRERAREMDQELAEEALEEAGVYSEVDDLKSKGNFYCKVCDDVFDRPSASERCPVCYGQLFEIDENRYLESK